MVRTEESRLDCKPCVGMCPSHLGTEHKPVLDLNNRSKEKYIIRDSLVQTLIANESFCSIAFKSLQWHGMVLGKKLPLLLL